MQNMFQPSQTHRRHRRTSEKICQERTEVTSVNECSRVLLLASKDLSFLKMRKIMWLSWNGLSLISFCFFFSTTCLSLISCVNQGIMREQRTNLWAGSWDVCTHCRCQKPLLQTAAWAWFPRDIYWPASQTEHSKGSGFKSSSRLTQMHFCHGGKEVKHHKRLFGWSKAGRRLTHPEVFHARRTARETCDQKLETCKCARINLKPLPWCRSERSTSQFPVRSYQACESQTDALQTKHGQFQDASPHQQCKQVIQALVSYPIWGCRGAFCCVIQRETVSNRSSWKKTPGM